MPLSCALSGLDSALVLQFTELLSLKLEGPLTVLLHSSHYQLLLGRWRWRFPLHVNPGDLHCSMRNRFVLPTCGAAVGIVNIRRSAEPVNSLNS